MIELSDIQTAANRIQNHILATPLVFSQAFSQMFGGDIYLKMENLQKTGSFKARGAMNLILALRDQIPENGVVAASAGNHAQGVALAARQAGLPATIVMPDAPVKVVKKAQVSSVTTAMPPGAQPNSARLTATSRRGAPLSASR